MRRLPPRDILKLAGQEGKPLLLGKKGAGSCCSLPVVPCPSESFPGDVGTYGMCPNQEEEETDELLLLDEEMLDAPPEDLPRRLLTNFAVYNAEVGARGMKWHEHSSTIPNESTFSCGNVTMCGFVRL